MNTTDDLNRTRIKLTHRDGHVTRATRKEAECVRLTNAYNRTAFEARIIDVCVEWDDDTAPTPAPAPRPKFFAGRELETNLWCVKDGSVNGPRCSERFVGADAEQQAEARAAEMNADEAKRTTRYGVAITVVDAQHSYIETADRIGYGKPSKATHGAPTVPATKHTPTDAEDIPQADPWIGTHTTQGTEESAKAYTARQHGTLYSSNSFLVQANEHGVEITNMHTGDGRWLENSKLADDVRAVLTVIPARVPDAKVEAASDLYLLQYFTGVL